MQAREPVYVSSFGPLCMIFVAFLEVFLLGEQLLFGRLIGAIVICVDSIVPCGGEPDMSLGHHKTPKTR
ncbi:auxin-induced protein 5ng4-like [Trifolium pratense]|uniref:Auxin-induced protein 5ng4-like n=1 Tax=Trifolium pratense TaxID=57577 RepID=A0A2K3M8W9_TRIPR|nr:auxin-induced protein 5ng4-like [Trifolium pratense]